ncbi:MAG: hypothetical protein U1F52_18580 [Burkholderiales bacterium]
MTFRVTGQWWSAAVLAVICMTGSAGAADYADVTRSVAARYQSTIDDMTARLGDANASEADRERYLHERGAAYSNLNHNEEAVRDFSEAIDLAPTEVSHYVDRAYTYEKLGRDAEANSDLEFALGLRSADFWAYRGKGSLAMKRGAFDEAANFFGRGLHAARADETLYGVIWTAMTIGRGGNDNWQTLAGNVLDRVQARTWPMPILQLYSGRITPDEMLHAASTQDPRVERDQACEAWYYLGQYHLIKGESDKARAAFEASLATGVQEFVEYFWSQRELDAMGTAAR